MDIPLGNGNLPPLRKTAGVLMIAVCLVWLIILAAGTVAAGIDYLVNGPGL